MPQLRDGGAVIAVVYLSCCYILGIVVDLLGVLFMTEIKPMQMIRAIPIVAKAAERAHDDSRMIILQREKRAATYLENMRARIRILRGVSLCMILALLVMLVLFWKYSIGGMSRWDAIGDSLCRIAVILVVSALAILGLGLMENSHHIRLRQLLDLSADSTASSTLGAKEGRQTSNADRQL
jgi:hypothetical protein